jgi:uracil-DNA glycosylase family 4
MPDGTLAAHGLASKSKSKGDVRPVDDSLALVNAQVIACRLCPRLVHWREQTAREKRAAYRDWKYWAKPLPGFGDPHARLLVVGLAPAAHGGNRTGRIFTGDRSGDWLFRAMYRAGFASQPESLHREDGLQLEDAYVTASVRCAPPGNRPLPEERANCAPYLARELALLKPAVVVTLGGLATDAVANRLAIRPRPKFGHGVEVALPDGATLLCSYHPSQQNTFTGRLTEPMLDAVFARARDLVASAPSARPPA